jgi:hypothetical protein
MEAVIQAECPTSPVSNTALELTAKTRARFARSSPPAFGFHGKKQVGMKPI